MIDIALIDIFNKSNRFKISEIVKNAGEECYRKKRTHSITHNKLENLKPVIFEQRLWKKSFYTYVYFFIYFYFGGLHNQNGLSLTHLCRPVRSNICCPRDCVSRHNGGTRETQSLGQQMLNAPLGINGLMYVWS